ncbi:MAG: type III-A CRISPR-associated CARF protein Csm6 [Eubacteriaceae bacterium]|jgi:CRISPR type III-A/MTUBE-associated protein Csm6
MSKVLFSGMGTSDPARSSYDGPMLHIMRYERPDTVFIFLSKEIEKIDQNDHRIDQMCAFIHDNWDGYSPKIVRYSSEIENPSDMDALDKQVEKAFEQLKADYPDAEILINLSSGTPQMQVLFSQMALDTRIKTKGIQVYSPEKRSGTTSRTNAKNYNALEEMECSLDELEDAKNRCVEPAMFPMRRDKIRERINALIDQRDYAALFEMRDSLPEELIPLVKHLLFRNELKDAEARKAAKEIEPMLPFTLYPVKKGVCITSTKRNEYYRLSEYFLILKNLIHKEDYTDFLLRLNPFIVDLYYDLIDQALLNSEYKICFEEILTKKNKKVFVSVTKMKEIIPDIFNTIDNDYKNNGGLKNTFLSIDFENKLLHSLPVISTADLEILDKCNEINEYRNKAAHTLKAFSKEGIENRLEMSIEDFLTAFEKLIKSNYSLCDPSIFTIYQDCGDYIKQRI